MMPVYRHSLVQTPCFSGKIFKFKAALIGTVMNSTVNQLTIDCWAQKQGHNSH